MSSSNTLMPSSRRVLEVDELLKNVTLFLQSDKANLYRVALVSKTFCQQALKVLWRTLPTAFPIMKLVPGIVERRQQFVFVRKPCKDEWGPFFKYSSMIFEIQDIYSCGVEDVPVAVGTYADIRKYLPGSHQVFPSLRVLVLPVDRECAVQRNLRIQDARVLLSSPMLLNVHIAQHITSRRHAYYDASTIHAFTTLLMQSSSSLQRLRLTGHLRVDIMHLINQFKHLEYLDCNFSDASISFQSPIALHGLHHLQNLTVLLLSSFPGTPILHQLPIATKLDRLEHLALDGDLSLVSRICDVSPNITNLTIRISRDTIQVSSEKASTWRDFFQELQNMCPSIRQLEIHGHLLNERGLRIFHHIEPLFSLALESFCISSPGLSRAHLSDEEVHAIASAWPKLQHLDLFANAKYISPDIPTGRAIFVLTRVCGELRYVRMGIMNTIHTLCT